MQASHVRVRNAIEDGFRETTLEFNNRMRNTDVKYQAGVLMTVMIQHQLKSVIIEGCDALQDQLGSILHRERANESPVGPPPTMHRSVILEIRKVRGKLSFEGLAFFVIKKEISLNSNPKMAKDCIAPSQQAPTLATQDWPLLLKVFLHSKKI